MEDLYSILGCTVSATAEQIKNAVKQARLSYHPDKRVVAGDSNVDPDQDLERYLTIERAWSVLGCAQKRKSYDALLKQQSLMQHSIGLPVNGEMALEDFEYDANEDAREGVVEVMGGGTYWTHCRCGGEYTLSSLAAECRAPFAICSDCSLVVHVLYKS